MKDIILKSDHEIDLIRESSLLVGKTLGEVSRLIKPGVSTLKLDEVAEAFIRDNGAVPGFKGYGGGPDSEAFPYTLCISVNDEVVHGMPREGKTLHDGDIVSVDCGVLKNEYYGDSAYTFFVGNVSPKVRRLCQITKEALYLGLEKASVGYRLGDISAQIQFHAESYGYSIVKEMVGHGIGKGLHEGPEIPNYGRRKTGLKLAKGMVFAIEPMVNLGKRHIEGADDGWTIVASDGLPSAHYEHTIAVGETKCEILSSFDFICEEQQI